MSVVPDQFRNKPERPERPFRKAVLRGLGVLIPPLMTIVIFVWVGSVVHQYVLAPVTAGVRSLMVWQMADIRTDLPHIPVPWATLKGSLYSLKSDQHGVMLVPREVFDRTTVVEVDQFSAGKITIASGVVTLADGTFPSWAAAGVLKLDNKYYYVDTRDGDTQITLDTSVTEADASSYELKRAEYFFKADDDTYVPLHVYNKVRTEQGEEPLPRTGKGIYARYVEIRYLKPHLVIPCFLALFILVLYLLGKFIAARVGHGVWGLFERGVLNVPVIRPVYSSVKQVSDFVFSEREIEFTRVVAVEYPRKGAWTLGFVTGESLLDIRAAANEPVLSVLVPTSPMPVTGFTCTFPKSEVIDLNITLDQAFQFIVSCGVVVPPQQLEKQIGRPLPREVAGSQT